jgi:thiamine kinase-like enzyme
MDVEYTGGVGEAIGRCLGGVEELEAQIERLCQGQEVSRVTIAPLAPGRSGAVVALVRRLEGSRSLKPWVVKIAETYALLQQERRNFETLVKDRWQLVPQLLDTGVSRILIYECGGFLEGYAPTTLRRGYAQTPPNALSILMQRIVAALTPLHAFADDTLSFLEREGFDPPLADQLANLSSIPSDLAEALLRAWHQTLQQASQLPRLVSTGCHGDLNAGNILFQPGPDASYPLFIDFGQMHGNPCRGYPANGHPPFWDFAKLERDIKTRLFLTEASSEGLSLEVIVAALQHLDRFQPGASLPADLAALPAVQRLAATLNALRDAVQHGFSPPAIYQAWYRISVAAATLRVLFRSPDAEIDPALQQRAAAESVLALLCPASTTPPIAASASSPPPVALSTSCSGALPSKPSTLLVRSFASQPASPPHDPALLLDLTDLFHDRDPLHDQVWAEAIPQRIAASLPAIQGLPQPLQLSLACHLSIAWYLGSQLNPKRGVAISPLQGGPTGSLLWESTTPRLPEGAPGWQLSERMLNSGDDLALVLSVTRPALADAERAFEELRLPIGHRLHLELPEPGNGAIRAGSHALWLVDALIRAALPLVQQHRPPRLHVFPACPVAFAFLLGQQAEALGPTTVYEFAFNHPSRRYQPGMAS